MKARLLTAVVVLFVYGDMRAGDEDFSWQKTHAKISSKGDIEWSPQPFRFEKGASVRYIDYQEGNDSDDGSTGDTAWQHHPWDPQASGNARKCEGIHTYVFKQGVYYRGTMTALESGTRTNPIRLTSDPAWGKGQAVISG